MLSLLCRSSHAPLPRRGVSTLYGKHSKKTLRVRTRNKLFTGTSVYGSVTVLKFHIFVKALVLCRSPAVQDFTLKTSDSETPTPRSERVFVHSDSTAHLNAINPLWSICPIRRIKVDIHEKAARSSAPVRPPRASSSSHRQVTSAVPFIKRARVFHLFGIFQ